MARMKKDVFTSTSNTNTTSTNNNKVNHESEKKQQLEEETSEPFSFPMLLASSRRGEEEERLREMFIDMDVALPSVWESMKRQGSSKSSSVDSQEFDFSRSLCSLDPAPETPADELFYKGHLLPLDKLKDDEEGEDEDGDLDELGSAKTDSFSFKSQGIGEPGLGCLSPDRFPAAGGGADSRSSSFRSSSSYWDSGDKDNGDTSSSCRDSNGSSQDSCFEAPSTSNAQGLSSRSEVKLDAEHKQQHQQGRAMNWRKGPFKWKVLLGGSKRASLSASSSCSSTSSASSRPGAASESTSKPLANDRRKNHSFTYGSASAGSSSSSGQLLGSFFSGSGTSVEKLKQQQYRHSVSSSASSKRISDRECYASFQSFGGGASSASSSSSSKVLQKYLKLLKPFVVSSGAGAGATSSGSSSSNNLTSYTSSCSSSSRRSSNEASNLSNGASARSAAAARSVEDWRAAMAYYDQQRDQHDKELITCPSFLPGSLRVSSFSSRRSSTHASCVTSSRSSPNHSGVLRPSCIDPATSSMADLQSAVQGAIAHCKRSQTSAAAPGGARSNYIAVPSSSSSPPAAAPAPVSSIESLGSASVPFASAAPVVSASS